MNAQISILADRLKRTDGQLTVELMAVLPVVIIVAVIVVNALTFIGECAAFDRAGRNAVRVCATSTAYGITAADQTGPIAAMVEQSMGKPAGSVSVACSQAPSGFTTFTLTLTYRPTLFGMGLRSSVLGVALPQLTHHTSLVVDPYRPGILF